MFRFKLPSLLVVLSVVPAVWRDIVAGVQAARAPDSDEGVKVTREECEQLAADMGIKLANRVAVLLFNANGIG